MTDLKDRPHVWLPAESSETARTLLLLHGSGADEFDLLELGREIDSKANLLSPRGGVVQDGLTRFFLYDQDFRPIKESVIDEVTKLADFVLEAQRNYGFNLEGVVAVGFSNGSHTALALLTLFPELLSGVIAFGCTQVFDESPVTPDLSSKFVYLANGEKDPYSPKQRTDRLVEELRSYGAKPKLWLHPYGHTIDPRHIAEIAAELPS